MKSFYVLPFLVSTISAYSLDGNVYCGTWISGATSFGGDINYYKFELLTGSNTIPFNVLFDTCGSNYDTWLYLLHVNGTLIRSCDDCGSCGTRTRMTVSDLYNGTYIIGVGGYSTRYGTYDLAINCSSPHGTPSPIYQTPGPITPSPSFHIEDELECGTKFKGYTSFARDINYYSFYIESHTNIEYHAIFDSCGSDYDTHLYLYDEHLNVITHCDDCGECGLHSIITSSIHTNQSYVLGVGGYSSHHGNYTVAVTCQEVHGYHASPLPVIITLVIICGLTGGICYCLCNRCSRRNRRRQDIANHGNMHPAQQAIPMQRIVAPRPQHLHEGIISQPVPVSPFKGYVPQQQQVLPQPAQPLPAYVYPGIINLNNNNNNNNNNISPPPPAYSTIAQNKSEGI